MARMVLPAFMIRLIWYYKRAGRAPPAVLTQHAPPQEEAMFDQPSSRRSVIKGVGLGVAAAPLVWQPANAVVAEQRGAAEPGAEIWSSDYWVKKGDVSLY